MWWLVTLLVLALIAFYIVKTMKSNTQKQQAEHDRLQQDRLDSVAAPADVGSADAPQPDESGSATGTQSTAAAGAIAAATGVATAGVAAATGSALSSGDTLADVREMIKILNLDGPDAGRLQIEREQLVALRKGDTAGVPDADTLHSVASKLREMLA